MTELDLKNVLVSDDSDIHEEETEALTSDLILSVEEELGYKLPRLYIVLMHHQNGGRLNADYFHPLPLDKFSDDLTWVDHIYGIGRKNSYSLCGELGNKHWIENWGYPDIGVYFCDTPSAGHEMIAFDYRKNGPRGEPSIVHVDQEGDYHIETIADNFEEFLSGLITKREYERKQLAWDIAHIQQLKPNDKLRELLQHDPKIERHLKQVLIWKQINSTQKADKDTKNTFARQLAYKQYDLHFYLYTRHTSVYKFDAFLEHYDHYFVNTGFPGMWWMNTPLEEIKKWFKARQTSRIMSWSIWRGWHLVSRYVELLADEFEKTERDWDNKTTH